MDKIKYYLLWPLVALLATAAIYLILVLSSKQILMNCASCEELLWRALFTEGDQEALREEVRMQDIVNALPATLLPRMYPKIKILVKEDQYINAYAALGGRVILTTGLLENIKSENALLFVIGHEMAHLDRQDHLHEFSRMLISTIFAKALRSNLFPELLLMIDTAQAKEIEFIADNAALNIVLQQYHHAGGIDEFFMLIEQQDNNKPLKYSLDTHPNIRKRHRVLNQILEQNFIPKDALIELQ